MSLVPRPPSAVHELPAPLSPVLEDVVWPALPSAPAMDLLTVLYQLEHSQWWPAAEIRRQQFNQLELLLGHASETVPFYRERFRGLGLRLDRRLTATTWSGLPILTRREVQEAGQRICSERVPASHGSIGTSASSGSTGEPVTTHKTKLVQFFLNAFALREELWHGRDPRGKLAVIRGRSGGAMFSPAGLRHETWGEPVAAVFPTGPLVELDVLAPVELQVEWLSRERPDYLLTLPSNLLSIARHCLARGMRMPPLKQARTFAETVDDEMRALCREVWSAEIVDGYSSAETGPIAFQCPGHAHYHVQSEAILVEVIGRAGRPCRAGEIGKVIVTPLHNFAMPLIRYEVGDFAEVGAPCPCGRGLPVLRRIAGRGRNRVVRPDGESEFIFIPFRAFSRVPAIVQFQVVQTAVAEVEVRMVLRRPLTAAEEDGLRDALGVLVPWARIAFVTVDEIPVAPSGKREHFRSEVGS